MRPLRRRARARQSPEAFWALLGHRLFDLRRQTGTHLRLEPVDQENAGGVSVSTAARAIVVLRRARLRRPTGVGEVADAAQDVGEDRAVRWRLVTPESAARSTRLRESWRTG